MVLALGASGGVKSFPRPSNECSSGSCCGGEISQTSIEYYV